MKLSNLVKVLKSKVFQTFKVCRSLRLKVQKTKLKYIWCLVRRYAQIRLCLLNKHLLGFYDDFCIFFILETYLKSSRMSFLLENYGLLRILSVGPVVQSLLIGKPMGGIDRP